MTIKTRWNPERSLLQQIAAHEAGEPLDVSVADLEARLNWIIIGIVAAKGCTDQNQRAEIRMIESALNAMARAGTPHP